MPIRPGDLEHLLVHKFGFSLSEKHSVDHRWYELQLPGLPVILTKVSHSREPIGQSLEGKIARQLRVRGPYFKGMVSCTNSREGYERQVRQDPYPPWDKQF
jgi:hypothetical protein